MLANKINEKQYNELSIINSKNFSSGIIDWHGVYIVVSKVLHSIW